MLGKQWLNRYDSTDLRGTVIERSQNRQRKLDGIVAWYFNNVMESLPLMLQAALLLFCCALSRYLWEVDLIIASVLLGVTSFGLISYLFIVIAGAVSESCPYQTPGAQILRNHLLPVIRSTSSSIIPKISGFIEASYCYEQLVEWRKKLTKPWHSTPNIGITLLYSLFLPILPVVDVYRLGQAIFRVLVAFGRTGYPKLMATFVRVRGLGQRTIMLDLRCVSWMLQTSLDKTFHLTALEYLVTIPELASFDPYLIIGCFDVFISCINVVNDTPVIAQGLERLAMLSASCFLSILRHFFVTDPTSSTLAHLRRRYNKVFPSGWVDFGDFPFCYTMMAAHILINCKPPEWWKLWNDNGPSAQEHVQLAECIADVAQVRYQQTRRKKVPRWVLRFAFKSLSLYPPPPPSVVANCLRVIAIDLGCDVSNIRSPDERYV